MIRSPLALAAAAGMLAIATLTGTAAAQVVPFRSGEAKLTALTSASERSRALQAAVAGDAKHFLVQFSGPVSDGDRASLAAAGLVLGDYLSGYAFFASIERARLNSAAAAAIPSVIAIEPIQRNWKLHPLILADDIPLYALNGAAKPGQQVVAVYVMFHKDAGMGLAAMKTVQKHGGVFKSELQSLPVIVAEVPRENLLALADEDSIMWVEPAAPPMEPLSVNGVADVAGAIAAAAASFNDSNRTRTEAAVLQAAPYLLDGTGVNVFVFDGGSALVGHQTFTAGGTLPSRVTNMDGSAVASHATHVSGTVGGTGHGEAGNIHKGMAPNVKILSAGLNTAACGFPPYFLYDCLTDLESDYNLAINHATLPAAVANNSIGTNTSTNGFPCSLQGDYGITDALIDNIVRGSLGRPLRVVWANGNERQSTTCAGGNGGYFLTAPPATAKNHITVGALNSNNDSMTSFSSWGPTDDGRMKPDIAAPGCQSDGDNTVTSSTSAGGYGASCGTSMASPTVCGVSALILQDFRANFGSQPDPRNSTLKLLLAHTAADLFNVGPDYQSGYGSVRAQRAVDFMRTGAFTESSLGQGSTFSANLVVAAGQPLKVMVAWDDAAGTPNTTGAAALVNDLDLRLIDPNNVVYFPWTLNPATPAVAAVRTAANHRDNIEQVLVDNPIAGTWRIEVFGFNVPSGPQPFSITGVSSGSTVGLGIAPITALPTLMAPGSSTNVDISISTTNQTLVAGSPTFHFRSTVAGPFSTLPLTLVSGSTYRATLNAPPCNQTLQYYFSAAGSVTGTTTNPSNAPTTVYSATSGTVATRFTDNFQTNQGWTVSNSPIAGGTFAGAWERGVLFSPATTGAPGVDGDGSGQCFVTGNGNVLTGDVDFGFTTVTSPIIDASGSASTVAYRRWFHRNSSTANGDMFRVETSSDGGTNWATIELLGGTTGSITGSWVSASFPIAVPTSQFRIRFTANDNSTNSTSVEAGIDGVVVTAVSCTNPPSCPADWDNNGLVQPSDIAAFVNAWSNDLANGTLVTDLDSSGTITPGDVALFVQLWFNALSGGC